MERTVRVPIVAGNWKMHTTLPEAIELARAVRALLHDLSGAECVLCPPFISLAAVGNEVAGTAIGVGAQNAHFADQGAYTGEISPRMLKPLCRYVILGHSERRQYFGEDDTLINQKVQAAVRQSVVPILCVGENLTQNEAGQTNAVVSRQIQHGLEDVPEDAEFVIAYEPIWAIGTGRPATGPDANKVALVIRDTLAGMFGSAHAQRTRIQYGGSVNAKNAAEFFAEPEVDGALVGGASLKAAEFAAIVRAAAKTH